MIKYKIDAVKMFSFGVRDGINGLGAYCDYKHESDSTEDDEMTVTGRCYSRGLDIGEECFLAVTSRNNLFNTTRRGLSFVFSVVAGNQRQDK